MNRRDELLEAVTRHVLEHGLIGLTLRPVAAAIGTSDRMLIYHFESRDHLVSAVVAHSTGLAVEEVHALPSAPSVRSAVNRLWAAYQHDPLRGYLHLYLQATATGLLGEEPYRTVAREGNQRWTEAMRHYLVRSGAPTRRVERVVTLVDSALYGFLMDLTTDSPDELSRGVDDLARAAQAIAG